jgi:gluconolactonase
MQVMTTGLRFPEGPIAMDDGSIVLVEIERGTLSRVSSSGEISVIAECGGGPNGAAIGPDGRVYICNNGGFSWATIDGLLRPVGTPDNYTNGSIQVVDLATGSVDTLYTECGGKILKGPNDIVFDQHGGFYFTDLGKRSDDALQRGAVYYASIDGNRIERVVSPIEQPNGISLSPDGTRLYVAETFSAKLRYWDIESPGKLAPHDDPFGVGNILYGFQGFERLDSMAVDGQGNVCVATLATGVISAVSPSGQLVAILPMPEPDVMVTNICFGGDDMRSAFITSSGRGILYKTQWHCSGLKLNFNG